MLAEGGFATVYEAVDIRTKRSIAIKQIRCPDADHAARADAEIEAHGKLRHATIAELLDYGVERNVYRLAFPLYGASVRKLLDDTLSTRTCLPPQMTASILVAVGEALAECHACTNKPLRYQARQCPPVQLGVGPRRPRVVFGV